MRETEVIIRVLNGETSAFVEIINAYQDMVYTLSLRITHSREDSEEIMQDVFLKVYHNLASFKGESKFSTWIYRIAYNTAISKLRNNKYQKNEIGIENYQIVEKISLMKALNPLKTEEQKHFLKIALNALNDEERLLLDLFYLGEKRIKEIEEIIGQTASNIKVKLHRARKKLHRELTHILKDEVESII